MSELKLRPTKTECKTCCSDLQRRKFICNELCCYRSDATAKATASEGGRYQGVSSAGGLASGLGWRLRLPLWRLGRFAVVLRCGRRGDFARSKLGGLAERLAGFSSLRF